MLFQFSNSKPCFRCLIGVVIVIDNFMYLKTIIKDGQSTSKVKMRFPIATSSMARLCKILKRKKKKTYWIPNLNCPLHRSLRIREFDTVRRTLKVNCDLRNEMPPALTRFYWKENKAHEFVRAFIKIKISKQEELLMTRIKTGALVSQTLRYAKFILTLAI